MSAHEQDGFTIVELLAAMAIFSFVMIATLTTLQTMTKESARADSRNEAQQQARIVVNQMARQLRNLASPTPRRPQAIDKATPADLVFQSVDPLGPNSGENRSNVRRLRYCLSAGEIHLQVQTWTAATTPPVPGTSTCPSPDPAWTSTTLMASDLLNDQRAVWLYNATVPTDVSFIRTTFVIDREPGGAAQETTVSTGVFLRNQNRAPVAAFTATATGQRHVLLNGSLSVDPEGEALEYEWLDGDVTVGTGTTFDYVAPDSGLRALSLRVTDPGGLEHEAPVQEVFVV